MRFIIRTVMLIALVWIGLLLSGYGVLIGSKENAAGLGLQCTYRPPEAPARYNTCTLKVVFWG